MIELLLIIALCFIVGCTLGYLITELNRKRRSKTHYQHVHWAPQGPGELGGGQAVTGGKQLPPQPGDIINADGTITRNPTQPIIQDYLDLYRNNLAAIKRKANDPGLSITNRTDRINQAEEFWNN